MRRRAQAPNKSPGACILVFGPLVFLGGGVTYLFLQRRPHGAGADWLEVASIVDGLSLEPRRQASLLLFFYIWLGCWLWGLRLTFAVAGLVVSLVAGYFVRAYRYLR
ncbi:hypothetical protein EV126DRAFT_407711 [Verticillium dahliae]|nr:hypothetical protein EV126DRAFT_407711 [Verticillium dahliae]